MKPRIVFQNTYGLARSFLALSTLITLTCTDPQVYFNKAFFRIGPPENTVLPNWFYLWGPENVNLSAGIAAAILLWVISGYLPQLTGVLHAWITYSFFTASVIVEGGDQIAQIITLLLVPVCVFDKRLNHWHLREYFHYRRPDAVAYFCYSVVVLIQLQMAVLYLFAGADKIRVDEWADGSAIYYWFNNSPFGATPLLHLLFDPIVTNPLFTPLITWSVIVLELLLFAAFFMPPQTKKILLPAAIAFHFMIVLLHGLVSFFFAMAGGLILYLLPADKPIAWPRRLLRLGRVRQQVRQDENIAA